MDKVDEIENLISKTSEEIQNFFHEKPINRNKTKSEVVTKNFETIHKLIEQIPIKNPNFNKLLSKYHGMYSAYLNAIEELIEADEHEKKAKEHRESLAQKTISYAKKLYSLNDAKKKLSLAESYLVYLNSMLKVADKPNEIADLYFKIGMFYYEKAKLVEGTRITNLLIWQQSKNNFANALANNEKHFAAAEKYIKCLNRLFKYSEVIEALKKYQTEEERKLINDYYIVSGLANVKMQNYTEAMKCLEKADQKNPTTKQQIQLVKNLNENNIKKKLKIYKESKNEIEETFFIDRHKVENNESRQGNEKYRILSIDGGGIRGIIPAIWTCEIEKRTHKPISHLFNMLAGTSTGGIIAAGLSAPQTSEKPCFVPKFKAYEILDLYLTKSSEIFKKKSYFGTNFFDSKYSEEGRYNLFKSYFTNQDNGSNKLITLSHALTELVIPAANEESLYATYIFNRFDADNDPFKDDSFVDALMATSAAPTFFPSYNIRGKGIFNDGGVHVNNPACMACNEAIRYGISKDNLYVLSLGTGTYLPKPIPKSNWRGLFFWATHLQDVALEAQIGNTDMAVFNTLGEKNYQRWQVWYENPLSLDDYGDNNIAFLTESANQYIEELDLQEDNPINKLVESLI